ncbi:MAG: type II toxin-antitoxin system VapC family toxin [Bacteroidales bacterium]|nr:type II toxin-antitoxin system VapC family toxin [Bacteroidales bacterium]
MSHKGFLLDTNICIFYMKGKYDLDTKLNDSNKKNCFISETTVAELLYGAACSNRKREATREVTMFVNEFHVLPIYPALPTYAELKSLLRAQGTLIDDFDLLIGATSIYNELTLVTENVKHLNRLPNIVIENWINR